MFWLLCALISGSFAAAIAILMKLYLQHLNPFFVTFVFSVVSIIAFLLLDVATHKVELNSFFSLTLNDWKWLIITGTLNGLAFAAYVTALQHGKAGSVVAVDRLGIVYVLILSVFLLEESLTIKSILGALFMIGGATLMSLK